MPKTLPEQSKLVRLGPALGVAVALVGYRVGGLLRDPFGDGDLFWQRRLGEYVLAHHQIPRALGNDVFSAPGAPWVPHEWLFSIVVARAFDSGALWIITALCGAFMVATLGVLAWRCLVAGGSAWATAIAVFFGAVAVAPNFADRAEVWVWLLFAIALFVLDFEGPILWSLVPLTILWANLHGSVMLIVPVIWLNTLFAAIGKRADLKLRLALCGILPLATLVTPFGISLPLYALSVFHSPVQAYIAGWKPINFNSIYVRYGFCPLVALMLIGLVRRTFKARPFDFALAGGLAVASIFGVRYIALFGLAAVLPASLAFAGLADSTKTKRQTKVALITEAGLLPLISVLSIAYGLAVGSPGIQWPGPFGSVRVLAAEPGPHNLFCAEYSWCSVAIGEGDTRIFLDGRADPYPPAVWNAYGVITHALPGWQQLLTSYDINAVIAWRGGYFESQMKTLAQWQEITDTNDPCCVLFVLEPKRAIKS
jgi:hypothetical protein